MVLENEKIKILGDFLKSRRERIKPDRIEIASRYGRRRTPGLRREEVAQLAGVSITWYTWLEQGRVTSDSRRVSSGKSGRSSYTFGTKKHCRQTGFASISPKKKESLTLRTLFFYSQQDRI